MAISKATLAAIQKTGTFAHNLKLALQAETKKYSDRLSKALSTNANGNAFELLEGPEIANWKSVGKLAKMIDAIEAELGSAFKFASDLVTGAPDLVSVSVTAAVTVVKAPQDAAAQVKAVPVKNASPKAQANATAGRGSANSEKLLAQLASTLNGDEFTVLKQTELAKQTGIPLGSMTAALKRLTEASDIVLGKNGGYKLGKKKVAPAAKAFVAAVKPAKTEAKTAAKSAAPKATVAVTAEAAAPKAIAKTKAAKAAPAAKKVVTQATAAKAAAVVSQPEPVKSAVTAAKPVTKAAAKNAPAKKAAATAKPAQAVVPETDAAKSDPAVDATAQDTAVVAAA